MKLLKGICAVLQVGGLLGILLLFSHVEWMFVHGNPSNFFNLLVQLFVVGSMVLLPLFWFLAGVAVAGWFGNYIIRKKSGRPLAIE